MTVMELEGRVDEVEEFGVEVLETVVGYPRMRHKLRKVVGEYYFEKMSEQEYKSKRKDMLTILPPTTDIPTFV